MEPICLTKGNLPKGKGDLERKAYSPLCKPENLWLKKKSKMEDNAMTTDSSMVAHLGKMEVAE